MDKVPPKIAAAITLVMGKVRVLQKGDENRHGGYNFASIDKFLEIVGGVCAEAGLIIMQDEIEMEVFPSPVGKGSWLRVKYEFWLVHSSGEMMAKPFTRTVMVQATGGQSFGSAQSYTLKQFQRSLFQISTGDKDDVDFDAPVDIDVKTKWQATGPIKTKVALRNKMNDMRTDVNGAKTQSELHEVMAFNKELTDQVKNDMPELFDGPDGEDGLRELCQRLFAELPEYAEESSLEPGRLPVTVSESGETNWALWRQNMETNIGSARDLPELNDFADANKDAFAQYTKAHKTPAAGLKKILDNKRGFFAQQPAQAAE